MQWCGSGDDDKQNMYLLSFNLRTGEICKLHTTLKGDIFIGGD